MIFLFSSCVNMRVCSFLFGRKVRKYVVRLCFSFSISLYKRRRKEMEFRSEINTIQHTCQWSEVVVIRGNSGQCSPRPQLNGFDCSEIWSKNDNSSQDIEKAYLRLRYYAIFAKAIDSGCSMQFVYASFELVSPHRSQLGQNFYLKLWRFPPERSFGKYEHLNISWSQKVCLIRSDTSRFKSKWLTRTSTGIILCEFKFVFYLKYLRNQP